MTADFRWLGNKPLVIGLWDEETGKVQKSITIKHMEVIPPEWLEQVRKAHAEGSLTSIGHRNPANVTDTDIIERVMKGEKVEGVVLPDEEEA